MELGPEFDHNAELADSPWLADWMPGAEIEIVEAPPAERIIGHCVFDHDGTLSTLRSGWERIMSEIMLHAILGDRSCSAPTPELSEILHTVHDYIDRSTGIQTLSQMQWLVRTIHHRGFVPAGQIRDASAYKLEFVGRLEQIVDARIARLQSGECQPAAFRIRYALAFLNALFRRGIKLHLVSGTDELQLKREAQALGYAHLFEGRVTGAASDQPADPHPDSHRDPKDLIIERIMREYDVPAPAIAVFGDGPAEIRAACPHGCVCIGVASDEERGFGLSFSKRRRLIRAGAQIIIADYSELQPLVKLVVAPRKGKAL